MRNSNKIFLPGVLLTFFMLSGCYGPVSQNDIVPVKGKILFKSVYRDPDKATFLLEEGNITPLSPGGMAKFISLNEYIAFWKWGFRIYDIKGNVLKEWELPKEYAPFQFDISPDGKTIVFTSTMKKEFAPYNIYSINVNGEGLKQLTAFNKKTEWPIGSPSIAPDGQKIVFEAPKDFDDSRSSPSLYLVKMDGTGLKEVFGDKFKGGIEASWSPDMKKLTFVWTVNGYRNLFTVDLSTLQVNQLTDFNEKNFGHVYNPCYSPDGKQICFALKLRGVTAGQELFAVNADGSNMIHLTPAKRVSRYPGWVTDQYPDWGK
ncbi:MAG: hypothetical protein WBD00_04225 [Candidatus Omnitrophota bacterium]